MTIMISKYIQTIAATERIIIFPHNPRRTVQPAWATSSQSVSYNPSMRLAAVFDMIISRAESAFQGAKCIHDSFLYVQNTVFHLHHRKTPALLMKLDIEKAFDTVS